MSSWNLYKLILPSYTQGCIMPSVAEIHSAGIKGDENVKSLILTMPQQQTTDKFQSNKLTWALGLGWVKSWKGWILLSSARVYSGKGLKALSSGWVKCSKGWQTLSSGYVKSDNVSWTMSSSWVKSDKGWKHVTFVMCIYKYGSYRQTVIHLLVLVF